jgi:putative heme-binding domain-containing protein
MLTIDAVPTPKGDLLVACHSGAPDWGTGPRGAGKIFKISYADPSAPQPVLAYAASPTETRVIFDRPVDPVRWRTLARQSEITKGPYVAAGDRFESLAPGYQVVKDQMETARENVPVLSAVLAPDLRSLVVRTAPRTEASFYALKLPDGAEPNRPRDEARKELPQHAAIDVLTDLTGAEVEWRDAGGRVAWTGWLPHLDLQVARELTAASAEHRALWENLQKPGTLVVRGQLDLNLMLRPAIQPGAKLDYVYPAEQVTVTLKSGARLEAKAAANAMLARRSEGEVDVSVETKDGSAWVPVEVTLVTGGAEPALAVTWHTAEDVRARALPLRRLMMPWATPRAAAAVAVGPRRIPEIAGGDWERGRQVFTSAQAACAACHQVRGAGGVIGPDLSNLVHRDYASVLQDIVQPSAAINPDRLAYQIDLKAGEVVSGMILEETAREIVVGDASGATRRIPKGDVAAMKASAVSLMPEGLWQALKAGQQRDLMTFLLTEPPAGGGR